MSSFIHTLIDTSESLKKARTHTETMLKMKESGDIEKGRLYAILSQVSEGLAICDDIAADRAKPAQETKG